jgi:serine/threonine protein kinase/WD40 repeat protein
MSWLHRLLKKSGGKDQPQKRGLKSPAEAALQKPKSRGTVFRADAPMAAPSAEPIPIPTLPDLSDGARVADTYTIKRRLGSGAMGTVYLAHHEQWDIDVALKVPRAEILADPENRHRITREAAVWTDLGLHPHIAYCHYVQPVNSIPMMVIEYLAGGNLREWITDRKCSDLDVGLDLAMQFCHALEHAHAKGLVHRDIKPENVLLAIDGTLKLTDFGIARATGVGELKVDTAVALAGQTVGAIGTYEYMAPEQFNSAHKVDHRADLFAFGVCLYEMFCGRRPYHLAVGKPLEPPDPSRLNNSLPRPLCELLATSVAWNPDRRPPNAEFIRRSLASIRKLVFHEVGPYAANIVPAPDADELNNRALSHLHLGNHEKARQLWQQSLAADAQHIPTRFNLNLASWRHGDITDDVAVAALTDLARQSPSVESHTSLAQFHIERGDCQLALASLEAADSVLAVFPSDFPPALESSRRAAMNCGRHVATVTKTSCEIRLQPDAPEQLEHAPHILMLNVVNSLTGHRTALTYANTMSIGRHLLLLPMDNKAIQCYELATGSRSELDAGFLPYPLYDTPPIYSSSEGSHVVTCGTVAKGWDLTSGRTLWSESSFNASAAALDPSSNILLLASAGEIEYRRFLDNRPINRWKAHNGTIHMLYLTSDRARVVSGDESCIKIWDLVSHRCLRAIDLKSARAKKTEVIDDGHMALVLTEEGSLHVWDLDAGVHVGELLANHSRVSCISSVRGDYAVSLERGRSDLSRLWNIRTRRCVRSVSGTGLIGLTGCYWRISNSDHSNEIWWQPLPTRYVAPYKSRSAATERSLRSRSEYKSLIANIKTAFQAKDFTTAAQQIERLRSDPFRTSDRGLFEDWSKLYLRFRRTGIRRHFLLETVQTDPVGNIQFSSFNDEVYIWPRNDGTEDTLSVWSCSPLKAVGSVAVDASNALPQLRSVLSSSAPRCRVVEATAPDECWVDVADSDTNGTIQRFENVRYLSSSNCAMHLLVARMHLAEHETVSGKGESADGNVVLAAGLSQLRRSNGSWLNNRFQESVELIDMASKRIVWSVAGKGGARFVGRDRFVLTTEYIEATDGLKLQLWDARTGSFCRQIALTGRAFAVSQSPDERFIVCGGFTGGIYAGTGEGEISIWEIATGECVYRFFADSRPVISAAMSADGRYLITACFDCPEVKLWALDWELDTAEHQRGIEEARAIITAFVQNRLPYTTPMPRPQQTGRSDVARVGTPAYTSEEFRRLFYLLQTAGFGWMSEQEVMREVEGIASAGSVRREVSDG